MAVDDGDANKSFSLLVPKNDAVSGAVVLVGDDKYLGRTTSPKLAVLTLETSSEKRLLVVAFTALSAAKSASLLLPPRSDAASPSSLWEQELLLRLVGTGTNAVPEQNSETIRVAFNHVGAICFLLVVVVVVVVILVDSGMVPTFDIARKSQVNTHTQEGGFVVTKSVNVFSEQNNKKMQKGRREKPPCGTTDSFFFFASPRRVVISDAVVLAVVGTKKN